jgi:hypothetical protein
MDHAITGRLVGENQCHPGRDTNTGKHWRTAVHRRIGNGQLAVEVSVPMHGLGNRSQAVVES